MTSDRFAPALRDNEPECEGREARRAERPPTEGQLNATSRLYVVDRDEERQAMQMYGAQDAEELAMILEPSRNQFEVNAPYDDNPDHAGSTGVVSSATRPRDPTKLHLLWLVPTALVAAVIAFGLGLIGWCGDDALGCRFGPQQALASAIPPVLVAIIVGALLGAVLAVSPWSANTRLRRRLGIAVGVGYLVIVLVYLAATLVEHGWPR